MTPTGSTEALTALLGEGTQGPPAEEQAWLEALMVWVLRPTGLGSLRQAGRTTRLRLLGRMLDASPSREALLQRLTAVCRHSSSVRLLSEMGLPDHASFFAEAVHRLAHQLLPSLEPGEDLYALVDRLGLGESDARWLESLDPELRARWAKVLVPAPGAFADAARLLGSRTAALGLSRDLLDCQPGGDVDSPFFHLPVALQALVQAPEDVGAQVQWVRIRAGCRESLKAIHRQLDHRGVSTSLIFRLDLLHASLSRIDVLLALHAGGGDGERLALELLRGSATQHSLKELFGSTLQRLARAVVEHTAETGEHSIAGTRRQWLAMLASAAGGGALTAFTALFKHLLAVLPLAPAVLGVTHALNYSVSFVAMQFLGLSLASKQPAMTGASLARALEAENGLVAEVDLVASIARTQFIATVGNVGAAIPMAFLVDVGARLLQGHSLVDRAHAAAGFLALHPFRSWTLPFAALTGVFLWLSSLVAGWTANWSAFRSFPQAVARSRRVRRVLGEPRSQRLGALVERHLSGVMGYLALGFLLGFVPVLSRFAGLGLEVRHVTLSSASFGFDLSATLAAGTLEVAPVAWAALGIALIGVLNFGVSFGLALWLALQARGLASKDRRALVQALASAFAARPARFFLPRPAPSL